MQEVARDSTNARGESAFWYNRYTLRPAVEPDHDSGVAKEPIHRLGGGGAAAADVDVPMFLESVSDTILTTGDACSACVAEVALIQTPVEVVCSKDS